MSLDNFYIKFYSNVSMLIDIIYNIPDNHYKEGAKGMTNNLDDIIVNIMGKIMIEN